MRLILVMGVCGCGKSTVGQAIAENLDAMFLDADDFHPPSNVAKMQSGSPLTDADRHMWLENLVAAVLHHSEKFPCVVLACSALKKSYRDTLRTSGIPLTTVYLRLTPEAAAERVAARTAHFMPASLVASQFDALEPPLNAVIIDATKPLENVIASAIEAVAPSR